MPGLDGVVLREPAPPVSPRSYVERDQIGCHRDHPSAPSTEGKPSFEFAERLLHQRFDRLGGIAAPPERNRRGTRFP